MRAFDATCRFEHDRAVGSRWFIPISLLIFGALFAGLWAYLAATEEKPARPRRPVDAVELSGVDNEKSPAVRPAAPVQPPVVSRTIKPRPSRPPMPDVMEQLDDATLKLRNSLVDHGGLELARARQELESGHFGAALRAAERVLSNSRNNSAALAVKAGSLAGLARWEDAEGAYSRLVQVAPNDAPARYNFGVLLYRRERFGEAAEQFRSLLAINPDHAQGLYNLATLAQRAGRTGEARDAWARFTLLRPRVASGWFNLGVLNMDLEDPDEAARCFAVFHALVPEDSDGAVNLARSLMQCEQFENACELLAASYAEFPCEIAILEAFRDASDAVAEIYPAQAGEFRRLTHSIDEQIAAAAP